MLRNNLPTRAVNVGCARALFNKPVDTRHAPMGPNKPKKGQRTKSGEQASGEAAMGEAEEGIVRGVMEALTDDRILTLLKKALYPQPLDDKLQRMNDIIESLTKTISERDARIQQLERKVDIIEQEMDRLDTVHATVQSRVPWYRGDGPGREH